MRSALKWRFYCDHCKKNGASRFWIAKHERHCVGNPERKCGMCDLLGDVSQQPMPELRAALAEGGIERLRVAAGNCPACMLASIVQERREMSDVWAETGWPDREFDYKAENKAALDRVNATRAEDGGF